MAATSAISSPSRSPISSSVPARCRCRHYLRLSRIEPTISDWEKHCRWIETELGQLIPIIDVASALREFEAGRTIIFHALRDRVPALDRFALDIEAEIGHNVTADAFITPPNSQCWEPHYDVVDLFVVQIHGSKRWQLWEPTVAVPLPTHCPDQNEATRRAAGHHPRRRRRLVRTAWNTPCGIDRRRRQRPCHGLDQRDHLARCDSHDARSSSSRAGHAGVAAGRPQQRPVAARRGHGRHVDSPRRHARRIWPRGRCPPHCRPLASTAIDPCRSADRSDHRRGSIPA